VNRTATGISLGLIGGMLYAHRSPLGAHRGLFGMAVRPGGPTGRGLTDALPRLTKALDLTPDQVERLRPKLEHSRAEFAAVRESLVSRIETELTPEQLARWREMRRAHAFPGNSRGPRDRTSRAEPGDQGEQR